MAKADVSVAASTAVTSNQTCNHTDEYQAIFNGVNVSIMIHCLEDGRILDANRAACDLFACSYDDLANAPLSFIWPAAVDPAALTPIRRSFAEAEDHCVSLSCFCRRKNGTDFWADVRLQEWSIGGSSRIVCVIRDITERRDRELKPRESEDRLRHIVESSRDIIYRRVVATGRVEYASSAVQDILGYSPEEMIAMSREQHLAMVHQDNRGELAGHLDEVLSGRSDGKDLYFVRFRMRHKSGEWVWLEGNFNYPCETNGEHRYVVGVLRSADSQMAAAGALRTSEERHRRLVENATVGIVVAQDGYLKYANPKTAEYTDFTLQELLERPWIEVIHPDDRATALEKHRARYQFDSGTETYRVRLVRRNGTARWIEIGGVKVEWEGRPATINFLTDVDLQVRAEQSLRAERDLVSRLMETTPVGVQMVDRNGTIAFVNAQAEKILGMSLDEIRQVPHEQWRFLDNEGRVVPPEERPFAVAERTLKPVYNHQHALDLPDGRRLYFSISVSPLLTAAGEYDGFVATFADITDHWMAEEQARMFKTIADHSPYGVILWNLENQVVYANSAAAAMHGHRPDELVGQPVQALVSADQLPELMAARHALMTTGPLSNKELFHMHQDGHLFPTMTAATVVSDNAGNPKFIATTIVDMTETHRLQDYAARAERLEAAGRIAGQVAHDFNNLLGPLVAYPELLRDEIGLGHAAEPYIEAMETAARQMAEINQQLLTLGRRGHYAVDPICLNQVIRQIAEQVKSRTANVAVVLDLQPDLMNVKAGAAQISRALLNLVNNALDAMDDVGKLTIRTQNWYADHLIGNFSQIPQGEYVKLSVGDSGCGMRPEVLNRVFEPFFTTKAPDVNRGSGLGLSVVHAVVKDHQGYIDIESRVGEGTSIYIYLPVTREEADVSDNSILRGKGESILVVDDDPLQREVSFRLLSRLGYNVHTSDSGEKALKRLRLEKFDLLIIDMIMPGGMDGADTLGQVLAISPSQKAIIASGYAENERLDQARELGATVFLRKPLTMATLARAVRTALDRVPALDT